MSTEMKNKGNALVVNNKRVLAHFLRFLHAEL